MVNCNHQKINIQEENIMFKKLVELGLKFSCSAIGAIALFMVGIAAGTMSSLGIYEHKMPASLIRKDGE